MIGRKRILENRCQCLNWGSQFPLFKTEHPEASPVFISFPVSQKYALNRFSFSFKTLVLSPAMFSQKREEVK